MESGRSTALAHPIQGLVKYHGLRDVAARIPFHASISVCTAPTVTRTTVAVLDGGRDEVRIDGREPDARARERVQDVVDALRRKAGDDRAIRMDSQNSFPSRIGLGSSASGFAALAVAAAAAFDLDLSPADLSAVARLGAGSAARSVTGHFSEWTPPLPGSDAESVSHRLPGADAIDMRIVVPVVRHDEPTEGVHQEVLTSPFFDARLAYLPPVLDRMRDAVRRGVVAEIGALAEADTLNLHAVTMTTRSGRLTWQPETVAVMQRVRRLREEGVPCWFSIDTGATPYVNTTAQHEPAVAQALEALPGIGEVLRLRVGREAHLVQDHLF